MITCKLWYARSGNTSLGIEICSGAAAAAGAAAAGAFGPLVLLPFACMAASVGLTFFAERGSLLAAGEALTEGFGGSRAIVTVAAPVELSHGVLSATLRRNHNLCDAPRCVSWSR